MAVLSIKVRYEELDTNFEVKISTKKLYKLCLKEHIPFHMWYVWAEQRLVDMNRTQGMQQV